MKTALWCIALAVAFAGGLMFAALPREEPEPFTEPQMIWLTFERPRGHFVGVDQYRYCDRGVWVVFKSSGDWYATARSCWLDQMPFSIN